MKADVKMRTATMFEYFENSIKKDYLRMNINVIIRHVKCLFRSKKSKKKHNYYKLISDEEQQ